jgi:hypothetical protein
MIRNRSDELSRDELFALLSNARRRYVLQYLSRSGGTADFEELTLSVAAWENEAEPEEIDETDRKRVYVSLYQTHLPRLEDSGVVEFDQDAGVISAGPHAREVARFIREDDDDADAPSRPLLYGALGVVGLVGLAATVIDVGPFAGVPDVAVGAVLILALLVLATVRYLRDAGGTSIRSMNLTARRSE